MSESVSEQSGRFNQVITGDSFEVLDELPENAVHAVVTDIPYNFENGDGLNGRNWDAVGSPEDYQSWCEEWSRKARRVLKPGGHLVVFCGADTQHRAVCGFEDAGYSIEEQVDWLYARGMPKGHNQAPKIDKQLGVEGEYGEAKTERYANNLETGSAGTATEPYNSEWLSNSEAVERNAREYLPASDTAKRFDGWQRDLKPAHEPICIARNPISESSIAENLIEHGTGALNINPARIPSEDKEHDRYPSDVILGAEVARQLDAALDDVSEGRWPASRAAHDGATFNTETTGFGGQSDLPERTHTPDGPSRYFYSSKASKAEKTLNGRIENDHPTVKPVSLMRWLVRLVTAGGQVVLDPFAGSGTTGVAAREEGREFVLVETDARYADLARARCGLEPDDPEQINPEGQSALATFIADGGARKTRNVDTEENRSEGDVR